jgi:c-di-GMP-binding flagellar brake protein YcgR
MFFISGVAFLALLSLTLMMLWAHERIANKRAIPRAKVEELWDREERRKHARFSHDTDIEYNVAKKPLIKGGKSINISEGGMKLLMDEKLPKGAIIDMKMYLPDKNEVVEVEGEVIWTSDADVKDASGKRYFHSGIKFMAVRESSQTRLTEYIKNLGPVLKSPE